MKMALLVSERTVMQRRERRERTAEAEGEGHTYVLDGRNS